MLVKELIDHIQGLLAQGDQADNSNWTDRHVYFMIKSIRAKLIKQKKDKNQIISDFTYQRIPCIPLEKVPISEYPTCFSPEKYVMKSEYKIPDIVASSRGLIMDKLRTIAGEEVKLTTQDAIRHDKYSITRSNYPQAFIKDDYLYVGITPDYEFCGISLRAVFEDPLELSQLSSQCCNEGVPTICFDPTTEEFPMEQAMVDILTKMTFEDLLAISARLDNDLTQNYIDNTEEKRRSK